MCPGAAAEPVAAEPPPAAAPAQDRAQPPAEGEAQQQQQQQPAGSKLSAGTASGSGKAAGRRGSGGGGGGGSRDGEESKVLVAGKEVVGRQVAVWSPKQGDWPKAVIAQYNTASQQHLVRYLDRSPGEVKHREEWVHLARTRFQWLTGPPQGAPPNPTFASAPRGEEAVHCKVRVFWPGMCRWYTGKIVSYDAKTRKHKVRYRDGDTQELVLRDEAVQYLEKEGPPARVRGPDPRRGGGRGGGAAAKKGSSAGTPRAGKRGREGSAGVEGDSFTGDAPDEPPRIRFHHGGGEQEEREAAGGFAAVPVAAPPTASPPKDVVAGSHDVSAVMGDSEEGQGYSEGAAHSDDAPSSSGMASEEDLGSEVYISEGEMMLGEEEEEDSDFEVESARGRRRGSGARAGAGRSASRRSGAARSVGAGGVRRRDGRRGGGARRGLARGARSGVARTSSARRDPASLRPSSAFRKVLRGDEEAIKAAGAGIVGARVAVFSHSDESYHKGKLVQFDSYHKRHKVAYDDGDEEWVSLPREAFRWLTPRARSAGCTREYRGLMQQLGAEDCGLAALSSVSTRRQAAAGGGGGSAGEAACPPGEACVGWQLSLLFDGDGQWYRGEVLGYDPSTSRALLLYDDGEDEWVDLAQEELSWHCQLAGHSGVYPGVPRGHPVPQGSGAVGWRVAVYWPTDQAFYAGEVVGFDEASGKHDVQYDDGEEGQVNLSVDRVKWVLAPGAAADRERLEGEGGAGRGRRRAADDSDPDFEVFEYRPRAPPRRSLPRLLSEGLSPAPTPMACAAAAQAWDAGVGAEASLAENHPSRHLTLPHMRPQGPGTAAAAAAAAEAAQNLGQPVVVRQLTRAVGLASLNGGSPESSVTLTQPVTVRIYMSSSANSTGSAGSADTAVAAGAAGGGVAGGGGGNGAAAPAAAPAQHPDKLQGAARLQARLRALEQMSRRVAKAQQTIVKGVPTPLPSRKAAAAEAARQARSAAAAAAGGFTSPTAAQRQQQLLLGSSHASGLHRLARGSAVNYSPFHHKRPHPADSEASSSAASSEEEDEEEEEEDDMGADSAEACRAGAALHAAAGPGADPSELGGLPLSPRSLPKGGKIKPLGEAEQQEGSNLSDAMLTAPPALGTASPAILSPFKPGPACPPVEGGGLDAGLPGMPHSASLGGGMDALMMPLPVGMARGDSNLNLGNLMAGHGLAGMGMDSRNTSAMLGGGNSGLLGLERDELEDDGTGGRGAVGVGSGGEDLLGRGPAAMALDALQHEQEAQ